MLASLLKSSMRELKKGREKLETRTTPRGRTQLLYIIPLVAIVLGIICLPLANAVPQGSFFDGFFWIAGLILIFIVGLLGGIIELGLILWRARAAKAPQ